MSGHAIPLDPSRWRTRDGDLWTLAELRSDGMPEDESRYLRATLKARPVGDERTGSCLRHPFMREEGGTVRDERPDLRQAAELRLWLRANRVGGSLPLQPFYLQLEAARDAEVEAEWSRSLPVAQAGRWALHTLTLADMPEPLREALGELRITAQRGPNDLTIDVGDGYTARPEPLSDVDRALRARLTRERNGEAVAVDFDVPETTVRPAPPMIWITPLSIADQGHRGASVDLVDNYVSAGGEGGGILGHIRPRPHTVELGFRIDVYAANRESKVILLDQILADFAQRPYLIVNHERLMLVPFTPSAEESSSLAPPGRTPLFFKVLIEIESGPRRPPPGIVQKVKVETQAPD